MPLRLPIFSRLKKNSNLFFLILIAGLIVSLIFLYLLIPPSQTGENNTEVNIGGNIIKVEIADSHEERAQGLSSRDNLPKNHGMLFVFVEAKKYSFWMKDMKFPIDIIWINNEEIVTITKNVKPETTSQSSLTRYRPNEPAQYVLEVNANYTLENGIKVGDRVEISGFN